MVQQPSFIGSSALGLSQLPVVQNAQNQDHVGQDVPGHQNNALEQSLDANPLSGVPQNGTTPAPLETLNLVGLATGGNEALSDDQQGLALSGPTMEEDDEGQNEDGDEKESKFSRRGGKKGDMDSGSRWSKKLRQCNVRNVEAGNY